MTPAQQTSWRVPVRAKVVLVTATAWQPVPAGKSPAQLQGLHLQKLMVAVDRQATKELLAVAGEGNRKWSVSSPV